MAESFARDIYGSSKGYIRLNVLWQDLLTALPHLVDGPSLKVLDAGGGMGQVTARLAKLGHHVTLADPSSEMLAKAQATLETEGLSEQVYLLHSDIQSLPAETYDLVLNHAVLEWLAEPRETLKLLLEKLTPSAYLSLMFYNRNAALWGRVMSARFEDARRFKAGLPVGESTPLDAGEVKDWLREAGLRILSRSGIRIFHDHIPENLKTPDTIKKLLELEFELRQTEPFASLGRHMHFIARL